MAIRLLIPVMAVAAFYAYSLFGFAGTAALLAGYGLLGVVSRRRMQHAEQAIVARLERLSDAELRAMLPQLEAKDRVEVERVLRRLGRLSSDPPHAHP
ncbi:MAG: hypothetical protein AAF447_07385 [Myxococcota bacterium]